MIKFQQRFTS